MSADVQKMARYVPRRSGTSKTTVSSVVEFSHTSGAFRAASIRSAPLTKRPDSPVAKNASASRMAWRVTGLGSLEGKGRGPVFASSSSCLQCFIDAHLILFDAFAESRTHSFGWVGDDINLSSKFLLEFMGEFVKRAERHDVAAD